MTVPRCCICYTTDRGYLVPTLVSAIQARQHSAADKADVAIFGFGMQAAEAGVFEAICIAERIRFIAVPGDAIEGAPAMLARLFLSRFVSDQYEQLLYMDGDTQIAGSLDPLIDAEVPPGCFLAANDPMTFALPGDDTHSRDVARHFASLGIPQGQADSYFNTGVLRINRQGWEQTGAAAWELFRAGGGKSRFPDQDVLNSVGRTRRIPMSLAWNFPIFMNNCRLAAVITPRIWHFMSSPKPWHGTFPPWQSTAAAPYPAIIARYPDLRAYRDPLPIAQWLRYQIQQRYKKASETLNWGRGPRRDRIVRYERDIALRAAGMLGAPS